MITDDMKALVMTYRTSGNANSTLLITLQESANISFEIESDDQSSKVELEEEDDEMESTVSPTDPPQMFRSLSTDGESIVKAFATARSPANYTLIIYTRNPNESVEVALETSPGNASYDVRSMITDDMKALVTTYRTSGYANSTLLITLQESANISFEIESDDQSSEVELEEEDDEMETSGNANSTLLITLQESANISFEIESDDQSGEVELEEEDDEMESTVSPTDPPQMFRSLSTDGESIVKAFATARSPANYTLIIYTRNPNESVEVALETSPGNASYDVRSVITSDMKALIMTYRTSGSVNSTLLITLQESANISFEIESDDQSSEVELEEENDEMESTVSPTDTPQMFRSLSTDGESIVKAFATARSPANYTLIIYTRNPNESVEVALETSPGNASYDVRSMITDDMKALIMTYRTSGNANSTLLITLQESANISFEIESDDQSAEVELEEEDDEMESTVSPTDPPQMLRSLSTDGESIVKAFATARSPANYTLIIYTRNPKESVEVTLETSPGNASYDVRSMITDDMKALIMTYRTSGSVNSTLLIILQESANISFEIESDDQSSEVELEEEDDEMESTVSPTDPPQMFRSLSTDGESIVKAFATARSPANYTLIIYTNNPNESVEVALETSPGNASYDVRSIITDDMKALIMTYRTSGSVNSTLLITLQESANISFEIESDDQSSEVELEEEDDEMESTVSPTDPPQKFRSLSTDGESIVKAFATARSPANYTLIIYTRNPNESVEVALETSPGNASYDVRSVITSDMKALIMTYRTSGSVNSTLLITLQESANISFEIESDDQSSEVELEEEDDEMESTVSPTDTPQMFRSLSTDGESIVKAFATARSPANYTLIIYTRNPNESVEVALETSPGNASYDVRSMITDDMKALIMTYRTSGNANSTLLITLQESANISFEIESDDQSAEVELEEEDDEMESTVSPTDPPQMLRSLSTDGESIVKAFATARSPANYTLIIYTRNPKESVEVTLETSPGNASYDVRSMITDDMKALIMTYRSSGSVNSTLLIILQESANISFEIESDDQSSEVELEEEDDEMESTVSPTDPPQMFRSLSTDGESIVKAFATARSPANYTLIIYTNNPNESVEVALETSPGNASYDVRSIITDDMKALIMTYRTSGSVNSTLLITLQESANISFEIESDDQSSEVELEEEDDEMESTVSPTDPPQKFRSLSTDGESIVKAFATARSPANYTLIIYTNNPNESVEVALETSPGNASYDVRSMITDDMKALIMTYRTSGNANSTLLITLQESANISFEIESDDQSSEVELEEEDDEMESTVSPTDPPQMFRSLSTDGESIVKAFATARSPANYTLIIYTNNPNESVEVALETSPGNASYDVRSIITDDMKALIMTYRTSGNANSTLLITLQESANISFEIESDDQSSEVELEKEDDEMESTVSPTDPPQMFRSLSTDGESTVKAFATARSPANYTLIIYTRNPNESVEVTLETSPGNASYDVRSMITDDMKALIMTYRTSGSVNSTLLITLQESANISFEIESDDQSSEVELEEDVDEMESTVSPTDPPQIFRSLSTDGESIVKAFATARSPANYTLIIYTNNPNESVEVALETSPGNASYDVRSMITGDMKALIMTYRTSGNANSTLLITLQESANISFEIESDDQSGEVELKEEDDEMESTVSPTDPPQTLRSLSTDGESIVKAFATARSPANYTLIIYTRNPNESVEVALETSPGNASYDVRSIITDDMKALIMTYRTSGSVNSTLLITLQESANISFEIESDDQSSEVVLEEEDDEMESTVSPTDPPQMFRSLSTDGESIVKAFATARSPANYTLIIYTRNPNESVEVALETSPGNASYDVRSMITDDMKALIMTYRTSGIVNSTLLITLQESANISFEIESDDQSSEVELEEEDDEMESTVSPTDPPQMFRSLSTDGESIVKAFATARSPANYTLIIYTRNPNESVEVALETSPGNASYDVRSMITGDMKALIMTYRTSGNANSTLLITLQESANISFEIDSDDQVAVVELAEYIVLTKTLSTQGSSAVRAFVSSKSPANVYLVIYTSNPGDIADISVVTVPANDAIDVTPVISNEPEALTLSFRTLGEVNTTLFIELQASANISFKVETLDPDSLVDLFDVFVESTPSPTLPSTTGPTPPTTTTRPAEMFTFRKALFAMGDKTAVASVDTTGVTMYTLVVFALDAVIDVQTLPEGLAMDVSSEESSEALITTFSTFETTNSKMFVDLNGPAIVTLKVDSTDASTFVSLAEVTEVVTERPDTTLSPVAVYRFIEELLTVESTTVTGLVATSGPANYTVIVHSRNPRETVSLRVETDPVDLAIGTTVFIEEGEEAVAMVFKTLEAVNTTIFMSLVEPANITIQVDSFDQFSTVSLLDVGTTVQPPTMTSPTAVVYDSQVELNTSSSALIEAFASTSGPANFSLFVYTMNPSENVVVAIETQPANLTSDVKYLFKDDEQALAVLFTVLEPSNTTLRITVMDAAQIILNVESDSELVVLLEEIESTSRETSTMTSPNTVVHDSQVELNTSSSALIEAFASTSGPANFNLFVYTMNPSENVVVAIETQPANLTSDVKYLFQDNEQALAVLFTVVEQANTTLRITVMNASRIILNVESDSELLVLLEELESTSREIPTTMDLSTSMPTLPSTTESAVVQIVSSNFTISGPANVSFTFDLVKPATIYIMLNASSEGGLTSVPEDAVQLESIFEDGNSLYILTSLTPSNVTFVLSADDAALIVTTVEAINANDVDVVIETMLKPTDEPDVGTTPHLFDTTAALPTTPTFLQPVTIIRTLSTTGVTKVEARASTRGPANYSLTVNVPNPSQNTQINVLVEPNGVASNFQVSASPGQDAITLQFMTSQESDVIIFLTTLEDAFSTFTVETVGSSSTADLISGSQPSTPRSTMATDMTSATTIDLSTLTSRTPSGPVRFNRNLETEGASLIHAVSTTLEHAFYEVVVVIPDPNENTDIGIQTNPQGLVSDLNIIEDNNPKRMTVRFQVREPAYTLISMTLLKSANISFSVETADSEALVDLLDMTHLLVTPGTTPGDASTATPSMGPLAPLSITRTLMTMANVDVQAFASLDRPADMKVEIYTNNPSQTTGISVLTDPQGLATDFTVQASQNPDKFTMTFKTVAAAQTFVYLNLLEAANTSFTVETASRGSASNQVTLMLVGDSTIPPPTTEMTPLVVMNTSQSIFTTGPSQSTIFINAKSPASVLIDVNGSAAYTWTSEEEDAFQVEQFSLPELGSFMRLIISRPVNITVTVGTTSDVEIVTTVMSMTSDAAVVTLLTESFSTSTLQPTPASTEGSSSTTEFPVAMTQDPVSPGTAVRSLRTLSRGSVVQASAVTFRPAEFLFEIYTPNPRDTVFTNLQTTPSGRAVNFENSVDGDKMLVRFKVLESTETQTLVTLTFNELANVSFTLTSDDEVSQVSLQNLSEMTPTTMQFSNVSRTTSTSGGVTTLVSVQTLEPSTIYLIVNASAEISIAADPIGSVETDTFHMLGSSVLQITTAVPTNITLYISTSNAALIETIVSSLNPSSAVILIQDEVSSTLQPPVTSVVMTTTRTRGDATIIEVTGVFSDEVTVFWSFDPEDEPFIQGFILQYREVGVDEWTNSSLILPSSRLFKLIGLGENMLYFLRLIAVDRSAYPAAFSFQKPVKTLSRNLMDPVPDRGQLNSFDPFFWIITAAVILVVLLLVSLVASLILYTRRKTAVKNSNGSGGSPAILDDQV
ncbi:uncharacterized protein [Asterias amurensis]|uniref:uncharacterized protein n=1 Tax=Asterias amurensis TaxID=7602 RepID=UPI003AB7D83C